MSDTKSKFKRRTKKVEIDGEVYWVQCLSIGQIRRLNNASEEREKKKKKVTTDDIISETQEMMQLSIVVSDTDDTLRFSYEDLDDMPAPHYSAVEAMMMKINKNGKKEAKKTEKNSSKTQS